MGIFYERKIRNTLRRAKQNKKKRKEMKEMKRGVLTPASVSKPFVCTEMRAIMHLDADDQFRFIKSGSII